jgi:hypothetical protein
MIKAASITRIIARVISRPMSPVPPINAASRKNKQTDEKSTIKKIMKYLIK